MIDLSDNVNTVDLIVFKVIRLWIKYIEKEKPYKEIHRSP